MLVGVTELIQAQGGCPLICSGGDHPSLCISIISITSIWSVSGLIVGLLSRVDRLGMLLEFSLGHRH